jgi:hypothetical protein
MEKSNKNCACCGSVSLPPDTIFEICPICGWQDDGVQNDKPDYVGGANKMSLNQAKEAYKNGQKVI